MPGPNDASPAQRANPPKDGAAVPGGTASMPPRRTWFVFLIILVINYLIARSLFPGPGSPITIPYTAFREEAQKGNISAIYSKGTSIEGRFVNAVTWPPAEQKNEGRRLPLQPATQSRTADTFTTELPAFVDPGLETFLIEHKVEISAVPIQASGWSTLLFG